MRRKRRGHSEHNDACLSEFCDQGRAKEGDSSIPLRTHPTALPLIYSLSVTWAFGCISVMPVTVYNVGSFSECLP